MLGLRADTDNIKKILGLENSHVSSKFSTRLQDRFYASGVSGSMQKHTRILQKEKEKDKKENTISAGTKKMITRHEQEIQTEATRLQQMEEKLAEVFYHYIFSLSILLLIITVYNIYVNKISIFIF